jgi:hypothetical protein
MLSSWYRFVSGHYRRYPFPRSPNFSPLTSAFASLRTPAVASVPFKRKTRASQILDPTLRCIPVILLITREPKLAVWAHPPLGKIPTPNFPRAPLTPHPPALAPLSLPIPMSDPIPVPNPDKEREAGGPTA